MPVPDTLSVTRPVLHFAPRRNWMNDPNGLVFHGGRFHLYFQYNPTGIGHGSISWGHASSADLIEWAEHDVAIRFTDQAQIYSGSAVVDHGNTSGLGTVDDPALVAFFTADSRERPHQSQHLAFSRDGGMTWTMHGGNPVVDRGSAHFRDPKVVRYDGPGGACWVMVAVEAEDRRVVFYRSDDLLRWEFLSDYGPRGAAEGVWECPDLFPLPVDGDEGDLRWVLVISMNPGGIAGGSGTMYVVGSFDGVRFTPDEPAPAPLTAGEVLRRDELAACDWIDFGRDCYAGVSFDSVPGDERILIAWMSNWDYAMDLPVDEEQPWRGRMTLARRLSLVTADGRPQLRQEPIGPGIQETTVVEDIAAADAVELPIPVPDVARLRLRVDLGDADGFELRLGDGQGTVLRYDAAAGEVLLDRTDGAAGFPDGFAGVQRMPVAGTRTPELELWRDHGSIEVFADGGLRVLTALTAEAPGARARIAGLGGPVTVRRLEVGGISRGGPRLGHPC